MALVYTYIHTQSLNHLYFYPILSTIKKFRVYFDCAFAGMTIPHCWGSTECNIIGKGFSLASSGHLPFPPLAFLTKGLQDAMSIAPTSLVTVALSTYSSSYSFSGILPFQVVLRRVASSTWWSLDLVAVFRRGEVRKRGCGGVEFNISPKGILIHHRCEISHSKHA